MPDNKPADTSAAAPPEDERPALPKGRAYDPMLRPRLDEFSHESSLRTGPPLASFARHKRKDE